MEILKIIDFEKKGNVVRFYLGKPDCEDYWGDDWDDKPYEHNAGKVYERYIEAYTDVAFPFDVTVLEPCEDWHHNLNSPYSKEDMKNKTVPCLIVVKDDPNGWIDNTNCFESYSGSDNVLKFYFGDMVDLKNQNTLRVIRRVKTDFDLI